jgi:hypothetical protein
MGRAKLEERVASMATQGADSGLWIWLPKKASGVATDVPDTVVRETALTHGLVDFKVGGPDATWSGHRSNLRKIP